MSGLIGRTYFIQFKKKQVQIFAWFYYQGLEKTSLKHLKALSLFELFLKSTLRIIYVKDPIIQVLIKTNLIKILVVSKFI